MREIPTPQELSRDRFDRAIEYIIDQLALDSHPIALNLTCEEIGQVAHVSLSDLYVLAEAFQEKGWSVEIIEKGSIHPTEDIFSIREVR